MTDKSFKVDLMKAGFPSENGRVYSREVIEEASRLFKWATCVVVPYSAGRTSLADAVATVELTVEDDTLKGEITPLNVPGASRLKELFDEGKVSFGPRGVGKVLNGVVQPGYRMHSVGMILQPVLLGDGDGDGDE